MAIISQFVFQSLHFNVREQSTGRQQLKIMIVSEMRRNAQCAFVAVEEARVEVEQVQSLFFDLDNGMSAADYAREIARRFEVTRVEARPIPGTSRQNYTAYLPNGEQVVINGEEHAFLQVRARRKNPAESHTGKLNP